MNVAELRNAMADMPWYSEVILVAYGMQTDAGDHIEVSFDAPNNETTLEVFNS